MNQDSDFIPPPTNKRRVMSFKAVIVLTKEDGMDVTLADLEEVLFKSGLTFAKPLGIDTPLVISMRYD